jgi:dihydroorotase
VDLVRRAKANGVEVTAEVAPHHFTLTDEMLETFDPIYKVNPPLRTRADIDALKEGLRDGTIDAIATDHAPHAEYLKEQSLDLAPPGMLGLETSLALSLTELDMPIRDVIAALSWNPARIAGVDDRHGRPIAVGEPAHLVVVDPNVEWSVRSAALSSKSRNTPYEGRILRGRVRHTLYRGEPVVIDSRPTR